MKHVIIGTAGHIDHGKTALIRALTGRDTDRLKEEKERGITIELGFTWFDLQDGTRCGIIDVPGHEKFIGNMVPGVTGMDLVLFVVAADEGVMPQTREHLDILTLLGVKKTILVLTKCDLVTAEWLSMAEEEIREELKETILQKAPCVRVSSKTGEGIEELKALISGMVKNEVEERESSGIPRLPADRVFTLAGQGTIVTGTLLSGTLEAGEPMQVFPEGKVCRIRNIQVHGKNRSSCTAGERCALNLSGISRDRIRRGCVIAPAGSMTPTERVDVRLQILSSSQRTVKNRSRLHFYTGTCELLCRAVLLDRDELKPGETAAAQLILEKKTVVKRGDRFVVRFYSPEETIGGGIILDPVPKPHKRFDTDVIRELGHKENGSDADLLAVHIREAKNTLPSAKELAEKLSMTPGEVLPLLEKLTEDGTVHPACAPGGPWYWHDECMRETGQKIIRMLTAEKERHPYRRGIGRAQIRSSFMKTLRPAVFDGCLKVLEEKKLLKTHGDLVCLEDDEIIKDEKFRQIEDLLNAAFGENGNRMLSMVTLDTGGFDPEQVRDVLNELAFEGEIVRAAEDLYFSGRFVSEARDRIAAYFKNHEVLKYTDVKEMFGISRKETRTLIGYFDEIHVTEKTGAETERTAFR